jgi:CRP/FNR family transcriptional regulator, cyclic AMP receptor protein
MKLKPEQEPEALNVVKGLSLFAGCPEEALKAIVARLDSREVAAGKVILMDQEIGKTLFIVSSGSVGVWKRLGGEKKQLAVLKAPDLFGERSMFEESPASALVKSNERCQILALEKLQFDEVATQFPAVVELVKKNMEELRLKRITPGAAPKDTQE